MGEKPILFSGPMVRAILEGRKTQTRRVMKYHPPFKDSGSCWYPSGHHENAKHYTSEAHFRKGAAADFAPYHPGDRLWVRETITRSKQDPDLMAYAADDTLVQCGDLNWPSSIEKKTIPSIFMPRWASRIDLLVTDVRAELLQEITEEDAEAEGVPTLGEMLCCPIGGDPMRVHSFEVIWNQLNAKRGFPWASNPWVWVYTFRRLEEGT